MARPYVSIGALLAATACGGQVSNEPQSPSPISGTVLDEYGPPFAGATVVLGDRLATTGGARDDGARGQQHQPGGGIRQAVVRGGHCAGDDRWPIEHVAWPSGASYVLRVFGTSVAPDVDGIASIGSATRTSGNTSYASDVPVTVALGN
jgi:hypothetical protein